MLTGTADKVLHACFRIGDSRVMASDGYCKGKPDFQGFSLTITTPDKKEADRLFDALGKDGAVQMPLSETFFSPRFGMVSDRFGVSWMIVTMPQEAKN
jgi:PhnB protein